MKTHCIVGCLSVFLLVAGAPGTQQAQPPKKKESKPAETQKSKESEKKERKRVVTDLSGFDLLEASKVRKQPMVVAATRDLPRPVALAPRLGKLYGANPLFEWKYDGEAKEFMFRLQNAELQEIFRAEVKGRSFQYPADATPLEPEKTYFWTVEVPAGALGARRSAPAGFIVVSASERASIEKRLGEAAEAGYWRFDDPSFAALIQFIRSL